MNKKWLKITDQLATSALITRTFRFHSDSEAYECEFLKIVQKHRARASLFGVNLRTDRSAFV